MKDSRKLVTGMAAIGAVIGTGLLLSKIRENNKSPVERFFDSIDSWIK